MKWSWKIGRIAGIDVFVRATFFILLAWVGGEHYLRRWRWADVASGLGLIFTLYGIIVLHELGHALTARHFGIPNQSLLHRCAFESSSEFASF